MAHSETCCFSMLRESFCFAVLSLLGIAAFATTFAQVPTPNPSQATVSAPAQTNDTPVLKGITATMMTTSRITTRVLFTGEEKGVPVLFLHGNLCSATWWEETMLALPKGFRGIAPDQRGFGAADTTKKVDATRGMGDLADDALALMDALKATKFHVVGNSLGGSVVWRLMMQAPERLLSVTLISPGSPYGFGGTKDTAGTPCYDDFAGTGAGLANKLLLKAIRDGDRSTATPFSPRSAIRNFIVKPPFIPANEESLLSSMMSVHQGSEATPGDITPSQNWPRFAPGKWGVVNGLSPKYAGDVAQIWSAAKKVSVLWVRGANDLAVSNNAASDIATLGARGFVPNYPGRDAYPPQPMLDQTRAVLEKYKRGGGNYREVVLENTAHVPHIENPSEFNKYFHHLLQSK